jgi:hypothetical protein
VDTSRAPGARHERSHAHGLTCGSSGFNRHSQDLQSMLVWTVSKDLLVSIGIEIRGQSKLRIVADLRVYSIAISLSVD